MKCQRVVQELKIFRVDSHVSKASSQVLLVLLLDLPAVFDIVGGLTASMLTCRTPHSLASPSMSMTAASPISRVAHLSSPPVSKCCRLQDSAYRPSLTLFCPLLLVISWLKNHPQADDFKIYISSLTSLLDSRLIHPPAPLTSPAGH